MSYPKNIQDCAKPPSQGGLPVNELKEVAQKMGIQTKGLSKTKICKEIEKILRSAGKAKGKKEAFSFLPSKDVGGKIGSVIKQLPTIRKKAGAGAFVIYLGQKDVGKLGELFKKHKELKMVKEQGEGWYIWAYTDEAIEKAGKALIEAEEAYKEAQAEYKAGIRREKIKKTVEVEKVKKLPREVEFPALEEIKPPKKAVQPIGVWGKPLEIKPVKVKPKEKPRIPVTPALILRVPRREPIFEEYPEEERYFSEEEWEYPEEEEGYFPEEESGGIF